MTVTEHWILDMILLKTKNLKLKKTTKKILKISGRTSMKNALLSFESGVASRKIRKLLLSTVAKHTSQALSVVGPHLCRVCDGSLDRRTALSKLCSHSTKDARIIWTRIHQYEKKKLNRNSIFNWNLHWRVFLILVSSIINHRIPLHFRIHWLSAAVME